jgi:hypothetical protein
MEIPGGYMWDSEGAKSKSQVKIQIEDKIHMFCRHENTNRNVMLKFITNMRMLKQYFVHYGFDDNKVKE